MSTVLTDGGLYFSEGGETLKRFSTLDGHGLKLLARAGITPVVITGRDSLPLRRRLQALGITHVHYGTEDKRPAAEQTLQALGLDWSQAAAIGDDWPDLPVLRRCAFACAPANAHPEALACARCHPAARRRRGRARVLRPAAGGQRPLRRPAAGRRLASSATCRGASRPWACAPGSITCPSTCR
jgi:3-deoxy-D-manno-octulosonate 8-phosphate phosphatase (KDO 8-P phosphatase)